MNDERDGTREEPEVEEAFVKALGEAARRLYNAPPETPNEEIWQEIRSVRDERSEVQTLRADPDQRRPDQRPSASQRLSMRLTETG